MATHSSVLAWRIPEMGEPGGLPSLGSHRVGHDWSHLAVAATASSTEHLLCVRNFSKHVNINSFNSHDNPIIVLPLYKQGNWGTERSSNLPKTTHIISKWKIWDLNPSILAVEARTYCTHPGFLWRTQQYWSACPASEMLNYFLSFQVQPYLLGRHRPFAKDPGYREGTCTFPPSSPKLSSLPPLCQMQSLPAGCYHAIITTFYEVKM